MKKFIKITSNIFVAPAQPIKKIDYGFCDCKSKEQCCDECINKNILEMECDRSNCSVGSSLCKNRKLQQKKWKNVEIRKTKKKRYGLFSLMDIKKDEFVIEYVGEIIDKKECYKRLRNDYKDNKNLYIMNIGKYYIDATKKGNNARFINHSCDPNCIAKMIKVKNQDCVAIYSLKNIDKNQEITFNYNLYDTLKDGKFRTQKCYCGTVKCKQFIFKKNFKNSNNNKNNDDIQIIADNIKKIHKNKNYDKLIKKSKRKKCWVKDIEDNDDIRIIGDNIEKIHKNHNQKRKKCYDDKIMIFDYNPSKKRKIERF